MDIHDNENLKQELQKLELQLTWLAIRDKQKPETIQARPAGEANIKKKIRNLKK